MGSSKLKKSKRHSSNRKKKPTSGAKTIQVAKANVAAEREAWVAERRAPMMEVPGKTRTKLGIVSRIKRSLPCLTAEDIQLSGMAKQAVSILGRT